jgi:hypothetical protein
VSVIKLDPFQTIVELDAGMGFYTALYCVNGGDDGNTVESSCVLPIFPQTTVRMQGFFDELEDVPNPIAVPYDTFHPVNMYHYVNFPTLPVRVKVVQHEGLFKYNIDTTPEMLEAHYDVWKVGDVDRERSIYERLIYDDTDGGFWNPLSIMVTCPNLQYISIDPLIGANNIGGTSLFYLPNPNHYITMHSSAIWRVRYLISQKYSVNRDNVQHDPNILFTHDD